MTSSFTDVDTTLTDNNQNKKKNRPKTFSFHQQNLPAWQPILTISTVIPTLFLIGICFIPVGVLLIITNESVYEKEIFYDDENQINISISQNINGDVYFYYGLKNFYQNHRRYLRSRNDYQLQGDLESVSGCQPYDYVNGTTVVIAPCGAIANSMFTDSFSLKYKNESILWSYSDLLWDVDKKIKFKNPFVSPQLTLCDVFKSTEKPVNWTKNFCKLDEKNSNNNGFENADFIIWMRPAALPNFKKPYRKLNRLHDPFKNGLIAGNYVLDIENKYRVKNFNGQKSFIISTMSWVGGKTPYMGYAYVIVGIFCIVLSLVFLAIHKKFNH